MAGETSVNLDSQWAHDEAVMLKESLAGEEERRGGTSAAAALKTPSAKSAPGVTFDASAVKAPKVADKTFPVTPLVTPRATSSLPSHPTDPLSLHSAEGEKFTTPHVASKRDDRLGGAAAAVVTGPPPNRVRAKGQPVGEIASSLEFPNSKRKCA